jgi:predicted GH43/DUF377 family glycosyl hydrolase
MWYTGGEQFEPNAIGYATSTDGIVWSKRAGNPIFSGSGSGWDSERATAAQVLYDGEVHTMFYTGFQDQHASARIGMARSTDGITGWERYAGNPIVQPTPGAWDSDSASRPWAVFDGHKWLLYYSGRRGVAGAIGLAINHHHAFVK